MNQNKQFHILALALSSRGFGYALMQGNSLLAKCGNKVINKDKNARTLGHIEKMIIRNRPDVLVLQDVNAKGTYRAVRIKDLHQEVIALAKKHGLAVTKIKEKEWRKALLGDERGTRHEMAELLAKRFPEELESLLPPKRRLWESEYARMDIFVAVALAVVFRN